MIAALFLLAAAGFQALAAGGIPGGPAPYERLPSPRRGFTLNAEVVARYQFSWEELQGMDRGERQRVAEWIEIMEWEREELEALRERALPRVRRDRPETLRHLSQLRPDFSGGSRPPIAAEPSPVVPGVRVEGGKFRELGVKNQDAGWQARFGLLGAGGRSPLLGESPYVSLEKWGRARGWFDRSYALQAGYLNLDARLYPNDAPALDRRIDSAGRFGGETFGASSDFSGRGLFIGSAMGQVAKTWNLIGPLDVGAGAMALARMTGPFPNLALDQTGGASVKLNDDNRIAVFGGVTQAVGLVTRSFWSEAIEGGGPKIAPRVDWGPHVKAAAWGKIPYLASASYVAEAGQRWNPWTTVRSVSGSLAVPAGRGELRLQGGYEKESGAALEFSRERAFAGVGARVSENVELSATYGRDHARYGNAAVENNSILLKLSISEQSPGGSVSLESLFGGQDRLIVSNNRAAELARRLSAELSRLLALKNMLVGPSASAEVWQTVQDVWSGLDPASREQLAELYRRGVPSGPSLDEIISTPAARFAEIERLAELLADAEVLERLAALALRAQILDAVADTKLPILGRQFQLDAPLVIAAAHAYGLALTPLPPMTSKDGREVLEPWLNGRLAERLGCSGNTAQAVTDCLLAKLPAEEAEVLRRTYGKDITNVLQTGVSWAADVARREMNALLLQVFLASERLNELTVDRGRRIGDMNTLALMASFAARDRKDRDDLAPILRRASARIQGELAAADEALRRQLSDYGRARLSALQAGGGASVHIAVRPGHWPALLAAYGDERLFSIIAECRAALAARSTPARPARLLIELNEDPFLNGLRVSTGGVNVVSLPVRPLPAGYEIGL